MPYYNRLRAHYETLSTDTLKTLLTRTEQEIQQIAQTWAEYEKKHPEYKTYSESGNFSCPMEPRPGYIPPKDKIAIILEILHARQQKDRADIIKLYIHFALIIGIIYILGTISDQITKHYTGSTKTIVSLAIVIIPLTLIIYLYRRITKQ